MPSPRAALASRIGMLVALMVAVATAVVATPPQALAQSCTADQWSGSYYNGIALSGTPVATRCDNTIDFDWSTAGPQVGTPPLGHDQYSVKWTKTQTFAAGVWTLRATADDGVRVLVDGTAVIDAWKDEPPTSYTASPTLTAGSHTIVVQYYQNTAGAVIRFDMSQAPPPPPTCTADQWTASYYNNIALSGTPWVQCEAAINNDWGEGGPTGVGVGVDNFSVRWIKTLTLSAGTLGVRARADDGVRVFVDDAAVIDKWIDEGPTEYTANVPVTAGSHTVKVEYYEHAAGAVAQVDLTPPATTVQGPTCPAGQWAASYFNNATLAGAPSGQRCDAAIDNDWGNGGPTGVGVGVDNFSVRWVRTETFVAGTLSIRTRTDDGVRVFVDDAAVIDKWIDEGATEYTADVPVTAGSHTVKVEYYEHAAGAVAQVSYVAPTATVQGPTCPADQWAASYFNNRTLAGAPSGQRCDATIDNDWGDGGPTGVGVGVDNFSVRWVRTETFVAGTLSIRTRTDDGVRVFVDDAAVIDKWIDEGATEYTADVPVTAGSHTVKVEYYEHAAGAVAQVSYVAPTATVQGPTCPSDQWAASYFNNRTLQGAPSGQRCDAAIDNDWGDGGPTGVGVGVDNFSVRWVKTETFASAGTVTVKARADDGVRVFVDNTAAIDKWIDQGPADNTADVPVTAGAHTIKVEYYEHGGAALVQASYTRPTCSGTQWEATYYANTALTGPATASRCEGDISYDWGAAGPGVTGIGVSNYSVRWSKTETFDAGHVGLTATADDGVRVYLDGTRVIDQWRDQGATTFTATVPVTEGSHVITVEYYQGGGGAVIRSNYTPLPDSQALPPQPPGGCTTNCQGSWQTLAYPSPVRSIHATVMHTGEVLLIAGSGNDGTAFSQGAFKSSVWNPTSGTFTDVPAPIDLFCTGHTQLADGRILLGGGTSAYPTPTENFFGADGSYLFDPVNRTYTPVNKMSGGGHWYPSLVNLGNGDVFATGGLNERGSGNVSVEIYSNSAGQWKAQNQVQQTYWYWGLYPVMVLMNDGRLFYTGVHTFGDALPNTSGSEIYDINTGVIKEVPGLRDINFRDQGGSLLLPPAQSQKVMNMGGGNSYSNDAPTKHTDIIDLTQANPQWTPGPDMAMGKMYVSTVILPDGKVLETGGGLHNRDDAVHEASIYDPYANTFTPAAADPQDRMYHSEAFLLPDGRVAAIGNNPADGSFGMAISMYSPWYMNVPRPTINTAPAAAGYGSTQQLTVTGNIGRATLIRPASVTHQADPNQRSVDLTLTGTGANLTVKIPNNRNLLPPGYYMLFVQDTNGVPSTAKWVHIE